MPEGEVDLHLDMRTVCLLFEHLEAVAQGARLLVDAVREEDGPSPRVGEQVARVPAEELRQLSEDAVAALDDFEQEHASEGQERAEPHPAAEGAQVGAEQLW